MSYSFHDLLVNDVDDTQRLDVDSISGKSGKKEAPIKENSKLSALPSSV